MRRKRVLIINTIMLLLCSLCIFVSCDSYFKPSEDSKDEIDPESTGSYTVQHWQQNIENDNYTLCESEKSSSGLIGERTAAVPKDYEGFVLHKEIEQKTIAKDEMCIVNIYYDRKIITVTLDAKGLDETEGEKVQGGGVFYDADGNPVDSVTIKGKYGASIESITGLVTDKVDGTFIVRVANANMPVTMQWAGYVFQRWEPAEIPAENAMASAIWRDERIKDYKVYHHFQDFAGNEYDNDGSNFPEVQVLNGLKGFKTAAKVNNYEGFFCVGTAKKETEHKSEISAVKVTELPDSLQKTIAEDDSTEIHLYYNRNIVHTTLDAGEVIDSATGEVKKGVFSGGLRQRIVAGRYGATIPTTDLYEVMGFNLPTCEGYTFGHWNPKTYPSTDGKVEAVWLDNNTNFYSVHHHFQNINDDGYDADRLPEVYTFVGKFGTMTQAAANEYAGFTCRGTDESTNSDKIEQTVIAKDDSTEIHLYYNRNSIHITLDAGEVTDTATGTVKKGAFSDGETQKTITGRYEAVIPTTDLHETAGFDLPLCEGYTFGSWDPQTYPEKDGVVKALWLDNNTAFYSVYHHFQNISDDDYDADKDAEMGKFVGKFGTMTYAAANEYEGFTCRGTDKSTASDAIAQKTIEKDGSTEIHIYYTRNEYTATFVLNDADAFMTVHSTNTAEKQIVSSGTVTDKYGAAIIINATQEVSGIDQKNPYREGYTVSWLDSSPVGALILGDRTYSASWVGNSSAIEINPPSLGEISVSKSESGSAVIFTATVSNCTARDYQWFVNGKDVSEYSGGASVSDSGTTLTCTPSASVFAAGIYSVLVLATDSNENVYSAMDSFTVTK